MVRVTPFQISDWQGPVVAKLFLKFEQRVLRQVAMTIGVVTIGRQPDNLLRIDNPAVSGHHAKVYREDGDYILEDMESFNGTYLNNRRIDRAILKQGDVVLVGKHSIEFQADAAESGIDHRKTQDRSIVWQAHLDKHKTPQLDPTMVLDTRKIRELLAEERSLRFGTPTVETLGAAATTLGHAVKAPARRTIGTLTVNAGKTNRPHYLLVSMLNVIGRSELASIRLRGWFVPRIAASIHLREDGYFLVPAAKNIKIRVNKIRVNDGQTELKAGDIIEVAGITATFDYEG